MTSGPSGSAQPQGTPAVPCRCCPGGISRSTRVPWYPSDMSEEEWQVIEPTLPDPAWKRGNGATVLHAPDLQVGGISATRRNIPLGSYPKPFWPPRVSRATAAALMLDEAEHPTRDAKILVPVGKAR